MYDKYLEKFGVDKDTLKDRVVAYVYDLYFRDKIKEQISRKLQNQIIDGIISYIDDADDWDNLIERFGNDLIEDFEINEENQLTRLLF